MVKGTFWTFQRIPSFPKIHEQIFIGIKEQYMYTILDDILCYGKLFGEHLDNLRTVIRRLKNYRVKLKAEKCVFFKKEIKFYIFGKIISEDGYRDSPINTEALETLQNPPKTIGDLQKLLGSSCYRRSICDFSRKAKPLYEILCVPKETI